MHTHKTCKTCSSFLIIEACSLFLNTTSYLMLITSVKARRAGDIQNGEDGADQRLPILIARTATDSAVSQMVRRAAARSSSSRWLLIPGDTQHGGLKSRSPSRSCSRGAASPVKDRGIIKSTMAPWCCTHSHCRPQGAKVTNPRCLPWKGHLLEGRGGAEGMQCKVTVGFHEV